MKRHIHSTAYASRKVQWPSCGTRTYDDVASMPRHGNHLRTIYALRTIVSHMYSTIRLRLELYRRHYHKCTRRLSVIGGIGVNIFLYTPASSAELLALWQINRQSHIVLCLTVCECTWKMHAVLVALLSATIWLIYSLLRHVRKLLACSLQ